MLEREPYFPYFCVFAGLLTIIICAYAPDGEGRTISLTTGAGIATGGLGVYGLMVKESKGED
jgi:hypothetical protein